MSSTIEELKEILEVLREEDKEDEEKLKKLEERKEILQSLLHQYQHQLPQPQQKEAKSIAEEPGSSPALPTPY